MGEFYMNDIKYPSENCVFGRTSLSKKVAQCDLFCYNRTGDENAEKRNGTAAGNRNVVHGYAGAKGTSIAKNRRGGGFCAHI